MSKLVVNVSRLSSTKGGAGGTVTTVSTLAQFTAAVDEKNTAPAIVVIKGVITGSAKVRVASNKSIIGLPGSGGFCRLWSLGGLPTDHDTGFKGIGLHFRKQSNLILRNIVSSFVEADNGDGLKIEVCDPMLGPRAAATMLTTF